MSAEPTATTAGAAELAEMDAAYDQHLQLTEALRRMIAANAALQVPAGGIAAEIAAIHAAAERIEQFGGSGGFRRYVDPEAAMDMMLDDPGRAMAVNPIIGHCSPIAPSVDMSLRDGEVHGRAHFGQAYVGPPERVHGGWVCGLLDQVLGFACVAAGHPGFTASITVQLRKATPLDVDLEVVGRVTDVNGRRVTTWGAIYADGVLTAEAEGLFVKIPSDFASGEQAD